MANYVSTLSGAEVEAALALSNNGTMKAWVDADSTTTPLDSYNVASGTDHGSGDYTYTMTNAFALARHGTFVTANPNGAARGSCANLARSATTVLAVITYNTSFNLIDYEHSASGVGDLA